jgi:hypothetical protein
VPGTGARGGGVTVPHEHLHMCRQDDRRGPLVPNVVALPELLYSADMARSVTFNSSPIVLAAAIYLVMLWPVVRLISRLERRIAT